MSESKLALAKTQGDGQSGPPGALLSQRLRIAVRDETGNPVAGVGVTFTPSPGAQVISSTPVTDNSGQAEASIRLPLSEGVVLVSAEAARLVTTFNLRTTPVQLSNFPKLTQDSSSLLGAGPATIAQKGALLVSVASIVRYYQNRGQLPGPATDVGPLNQALTNFCSIDVDANRICDGFVTAPGSGEQIVNLWRVGAALNAPIDASIEIPTISSIRDFVGQGSPVLVSLSLTANGTASGGHYVVASGIAADGSLLIADPSTSFARTNLNDYLGGFVAGGRLWKGTIVSALRLVPRAQSPVGFLVAAVAQTSDLIAGINMDITSFAGVCGLTAELPGAVIFTNDAFEAATTNSKFRYCDGGQPSYQLNVGGSQSYRASVTDFALGGRRAELTAGGVSALKATRPSVQLTLGPQDVTIAAGGVVNAATFTPNLAPGGLIAIYGSGLSGPGPDTAIEIEGVNVAVIARSPFQITAQVPPGLSAGTQTLR
ncbi:MAG: Ig-like domain-containing protein, partial [Bryobacteraceae bacterium]